ncbi:MAG: RNA polymerase sigma factor SigJ [Planctomycetota bacterium]
MDTRELEQFESARPRLLGLAYRMLGSRVDAEDVVQDCFLRWQNADRGAIQSPEAWFTSACTRRCLDLLKAAHRSRTEYVGPWLPEPLHLTVDPEHESLSSTLSAAFLLLLERLTPRERAAYLLHEVFGQEHRDVAAALELSTEACRQLTVRARRHLEEAQPRYRTRPEDQERMLQAFQSAVRHGNLAGLTALLAEDVQVTSDGGGKASAALRVLEGSEAQTFLGKSLEWWKEWTWDLVHLNGGWGAILRDGDQAVLTLELHCNEEARISRVYIVRNPDKLAHLAAVQIE